MFNKFKKIIVNIFPSLGKYIYVNRGLDIKREIEEADDRDDFMGQEQPRFNWQIVNKKGDWTEEAQAIKTELQNDMDCTGHAMKNLLEMLLLRKEIKMDISAAYINYMAGTNKWRGNTLTNILQAVAKYGWVTDIEWSEANRWKKPPQDVINKGIRRIEKEFIFGYDRIQPTIRGLHEGALFSPPYTGGSAWLLRNGKYVTFGRANHCFTTILHLVKETIYNRAKDSFEPTIKHLADNFVFLTPRRIYLEKRENKFNKVEIKKYLDKGVQRVMRVHKNGEVWEFSKDGIAYKSKDNYLTDRAKEDFKNGTMIPMNENDFYNKIIK